MITDDGLEAMMTFIKEGSNSSYPTHIGVGTGTTAPVAGDTALANEVFPTSSVRTSTGVKLSNDVIGYNIVVLNSEANSNTLAEFGLFDATTGGTMFTRQTHPDIVKDANIIVPYDVALAVKSKIGG